MGRNSTGPPWSVTDDDDHRRRRASLVWTPYTMCRRADNDAGTHPCNLCLYVN